MRFHVTDIFLPNPRGVLVAPAEEADLEGTIVGFSDSGLKSRFFAVVEVVRTQSLVVPMEKLEVINPMVEGEK